MVYNGLIHVKGHLSAKHTVLINGTTGKRGFSHPTTSGTLCTPARFHWRLPDAAVKQRFQFSPCIFLLPSSASSLFMMSFPCRR